MNGLATRENSAARAAPPYDCAVWTAELRPLNAPYRARLVVFPHSAAGPNTLLPLVAELPTWIQVIGVTLPGRERRFGEPPGTAVADVVAGVGDELARMDPAPTFLLGHSMGAALAFALAMRLPDSCAGLFLSGQLPERPPDAIDAAAGDAELAAFLHAGGNTAPELLADEEWRRHLIGLLRSDVDLCARASRISAAGLVHVPITAMGGAQDPHVHPELLGSWAARSTAPCATALFPGRHFYLLDPANLAAVADTVSTVIRTTPAFIVAMRRARP